MTCGTFHEGLYHTVFPMPILTLWAHLLLSTNFLALVSFGNHLANLSLLETTQSTVEMNLFIMAWDQTKKIE